LLAEHLLAGDTACETAFNFGPAEEDAWTVERVADFLVRAWGDGAAWVRDADAGAHEAGILRLDASWAREKLEWHPRLGIEEALRWTADWYRAWQRCGQKSTDLQQESYAQMAAYENWSHE
jgi:CDP-glucose 4,6-dehydratase